MKNKSIIIDFDNTIGYFDQFIFLLNIIESVYKKKPLDKEEIYLLLDNFPFFFRPYIFDIFNIVINNKLNNKLNLFILYSCNGNEKFVKTIIDYIVIKCKIKLFDYTIFNKKNKKSIEEIKLICNTNLDINELFCFIDDKLYSNIKLKNYFVCLKYIFSYDIKDIIDNFPYDSFNKINKKIIKKYFKLRHCKIEEKQLPLYCYKLDTCNIINLVQDFLL